MYSIVSVCLETNFSQSFRANNSRIPVIKNAKLSGYYFDINEKKY